MLKKVLLTVLLCLAAYILSMAIVPQTTEPPVLRLRLLTFDPGELDALGIPDELLLASYLPGTEGLYIVQFSGPVAYEQREALVDAGAKIVGYLPDYAYLAVMGDSSWDMVSRWPRDGTFGAVWAGLYQPAFKVSPSLLDATSDAEDFIEITIQQFGETRESLDSLADVVASSEARVEVVGDSVFKTTQRLRVKVWLDDLYQFATEVARRPSVIWIERYWQPVLLNENSCWICQSFSEGSTPVWNKGIHGEGQIVGISDTGLDADMCFFYDASEGLPSSSINNGQRKTIVYYDLAGNGDWDDYGHGTHCAGTIAGDDSATPGHYDTGDGMAFCAKLVIQDVASGGSLDGLPGNLNTLFGQARNAGARIHSNSWGSGYNGYDSYAQDVDEFMWDNPSFLIVFAAGNDGPNEHTVGTPATAKDLVSVGASQNVYTAQDPENVASFSSNGPTEDGRMNPTVCAPGQSVHSAASDYNVYTYNCGLRYMQGTSMSCPTTAGLAALVRQYYVDGYYPSGTSNAADGFVPSAALLKATLVNSARDMSGNYTDGPIPSTGQGWGRILLDDALYFAGDQCSLEANDVSPGLSTGQSDSYQVKSQGGCKLEVTLVWTDYRSSLSASTNLVNDLDLTVESPDSTMFKGNNYAGGSSSSGGTYDRLNVVECVQIDSPDPGTYQITVSAYNVPVGPQPYALVVTGAGSNEAPELSNGSVSPDSGDETDTFTYSVDYFDVDGDGAHTKDVYIDGAPHEMSLSTGSESDGTYRYETLLPSGTRNYYFYFDDGRGESARLPASGTYSGPTVDGAPPESTCWCDEYSGSPIAVSFSASDTGSGVLRTQLYYKYQSGGWTDSGDSLGGNAGTFNFSPPYGEGVYYFYTIATDTAGNREEPPAEADTQTVYDATAPSSSCTGPDWASTIIELNFTASDGGSGVALTYLWYRYEGGSWQQFGEPATGESGTFSFTPPSGDGAYSFYTIATDLAGNEESAPGSADVQVEVETVPPQSSCTAPRLSKELDISIQYTASDAKSGIDSVRLWYKFDSGAWNDTGQDETGTSGAFNFHLNRGDGNYYFYTIARDVAGNTEGPPQGSDTFTIFDTAKPESFCTAPGCSPSGSITVWFEAGDPGTNIENTKLYAKFEDGQFEDTGLEEKGTVGQFAYVADQGEGAYYFYSISEDKAGNVEDPPASHDAVTVLDQSAPSSTCASPAIGSTTFTITFTASDAGCGVNHTTLFASFEGGSYSEWGEPNEGDSGAFEFGAVAGDGLYSFYTRALDLAGNEEAPPATPDTVTIVDSVPASSSCTSPAYSTVGTIDVDFLASDQSSQIASTRLWYRIGDGDFQDSGLSLAGTSGTFEFPCSSGEAQYAFYTTATDAAGNQELPPAGPDATCTFDATAPQSLCTSADVANETPVAVGFEAADSLSGVSETELLFSFNAGDWEHSGLFTTGTSGSFSFSPPYGAGTYRFVTVCADLAGNVEETPAAADCSTYFDEDMPLSSCSSAAATTETSVLVSYTASGGVSGLQQVELWSVFEDGDAQDSGLVADEAAGTFEFAAELGDGHYGFFTIAINNDETREQEPASPDSVTLVDTTSPNTTCDAPQYATLSSITVGFFSSDAHSAIAGASLYYRMDGGAWVLFETLEGTPSGAFSFDFPGPEGTYAFSVVAVDALGNAESLGAACATTIYDVTAPVSTSDSPDYVSESTIAIQYEASDNIAGVALVELYYQFGDSGWTYSQSKSDPIGAFEFGLATQEGTWGFAAVAQDPAGNIEQIPTEPETLTVVDWTAPVVTVSTLAWASAGTLDVNFDATDLVSGFAGASLWYQFDEGDWHATEIACGPESSTLQFDFNSGEGAYDFWVEVKDLASNSNGDPTHSLSGTTFDATPPSSSCVAPEYATQSQIEVLFEVEDALSSQVFTKLQYSLDGGQWVVLPGVEEGFDGKFSFKTPADGGYVFRTLSTDVAGNHESTGASATCGTIVDTHAPSSTCTAPELVVSTAVTIAFSASDGTSGVRRTELWMSYESGGFEDTGLTAEGETGEFHVALSSGDGVYSFYTISEDMAGNMEPGKDEADTSLVLDTIVPDSTCQSPMFATKAFIVTFTASGGASDIDRVSLYYKFDEGPWEDTGLSVSAASGGFTFEPEDGDGYYYFATRARDMAGNEEPLTLEPDCRTIVDTAMPASTASCDNLTNQSRFPIGFTASDTLSGIASVDLYYSHEHGLVTPAGYSSQESSGTFDFESEDGDGLYELYTIATDKAGNRELAPVTPDCSILLDTLAPETSCESPESTSNPSVEVSFTTTDTGGGVAETRLLYRLSGGLVWIDTGLVSQAGSGTFVFSFSAGVGLYEFKAVSVDQAGNQELVGNMPCSTTMYQPQAPEPTLWVSDESHDFGALQVGNVGTFKLVVRNDGNADLIVDAVETSGDPFYFVGPGSFTLAPAESLGLNVFYFSGVDKQMPGHLTIGSNDPNTPDKQIVLSGSVSQDDTAFVAVTTDRAEYRVGDTIWVVYTLGNPGPAVAVDAYAAVYLPGDDTLYYFPSFGTWPTPISLTLTQGLYIPPTTLLTLPLASPIPTGQYTLFAGLCVQGSDFELIGDLSVATFSFK
ncbi:MAG TPA: S8 family serine peptidase [bacterium]|nr:S8 family serine peptidase [bacterium]